MGRRKRHNEPLVVMHDGDYPGDEPHTGSSGLSALVVGMPRPGALRIEEVARWEIEVDAQDEDVQGVRIYLPNTPATSRAFFPYPVHLDTAAIQKVAMRWLNRLMDMHYTATNFQRLAIHRGQQPLSGEVGGMLDALVRAYRGATVWAQNEKAELVERSGLRQMNGTAAKVQFSGALNFVAALSSPQDRYLVSLLNATDQLIGTYDRASLLCGYSQTDYVEGTRDALFRLESLLSEQGHLLRARMNEWVSGIGERQEAGTAGS